jgi:hypothetical protein
MDGASGTAPIPLPIVARAGTVPFGSYFMAVEDRPVQNDSGNRVTVTDIEMPFWSMVVFLVKLAIASIPAAIILWLLMAFLAVLFGGIFGSVFEVTQHARAITH